MGKRLWAIGKEVDARQGISGMTEGRGCPTGDFGHDRKKVIPDFFCRESRKVKTWMPDRGFRARVT